MGDEGGRGGRWSEHALIAARGIMVSCGVYMPLELELGEGGCCRTPRRGREDVAVDVDGDPSR